MTLDHGYDIDTDTGETLPMEDAYTIQCKLAAAATVLSLGESGEEQEYLYEYFTHSNQVRSFLSNDPTNTPEIGLFWLWADDGTSLLLTSDGLHDNMTTDEIESHLTRPYPAAALADEARQNSQGNRYLTVDGMPTLNLKCKPDDITVVYITPQHALPS